MNERLKKLRKVLDLTQQEFAEIIGSKRNTIAKYETEVNAPSAAVISLICKTNWKGRYVNEEWLRNGTGEMFLQLSRKDELLLWASDALRGESQEFIDRFVDTLSKLEVSDWELIANMAETLAKQKEKD